MVFGGESKGRGNPFNVYSNLFEEVAVVDEIDRSFGFSRYSDPHPKVGWLINLHETFIRDSSWTGGRSAVDLYFLEEDGSCFKCTLSASPYFYVMFKDDFQSEVEEYLKKKFESVIEQIELIYLEDLDVQNHLVGVRRPLLKLSFRNINDLSSVKKILQPIVFKNSQSRKTDSVYESVRGKSSKLNRDPSWFSELILDIREHDIPLAMRVAIDRNIRVGLWYSVTPLCDCQLEILPCPERPVRPDPVILAFDLETTKAPLKFPDASIDQIMMISYMIDGEGFLLTNREIVSQDIADFEYCPRPEYPGTFHIFNEPNESALIARFFQHIQVVRPSIFVTYNGDFFDWPFLERRASVAGIDLYRAIGFKKDSQDEYLSRYAVHMDAFRWVKRDSYLPAGSHGLKAVTKAKLGYNPIELDPELMLPYAQSQPQILASYSVSDAVATYYLYFKYVHPFIFSLCNIIALGPDDVLRKGSGTLCETLLMTKAHAAGILMPNKTNNMPLKFHNGHLLESETYVGGHVEALRSGVFRSDLPVSFTISSVAIQKLLDNLDDALKFTLSIESGIQLDSVVNYTQVYDAIAAKLRALLSTPVRADCPLIYHVDVAAMYPNIILTNRLQPHALVDEATCAACDFNRPGKTCQRKMTWSWRGEYFTASRSEYQMVVNQLESERFRTAQGKESTPYCELRATERHELLQKRLAQYCRKIHGRIHQNQVVSRENIVCQKENSFYVDTVRSFRDRRYEYKTIHKDSKKNLDAAIARGDSAKIEEAKKLTTLYDSLQLAHKCILNSFYGYVMRRGARWYSMEMAGIVCETGSSIIQMATRLVEQVGLPLELDTDGIWCMLPASFPDRFDVLLKNGKKHTIIYPCVMLNHLIHGRFTNTQYHSLVDPATHTYRQSSENSIFFEIDGPYHGMVLPASKEENVLLKKRYVVFNSDSTIAELKGFELKRRGELNLVKIFQTQIFRTFLEGVTLEESYAAAARVVNYWLDILYSRGETLSLVELIDLISENRNMSKTLEEYGDQKSTSISTAKRLAEFLGDQMVKDKGISCQYIITAKPFGEPVAQRAVPLAIFSADPPVKMHFLRKWLKEPSLKEVDLRQLLDWTYYIERFESVVQKIVTIPAAMQGLANPVARVRQPDWLSKRDLPCSGGPKQVKITDMVNVLKAAELQLDIPSASEPQIKINFRSLLLSNYSKFVEHSLPRWREQRRSGSKNASIPQSSLFTMHKNLLHSTWQIIGVVETAVPGVFKFWVAIAASVVSVTVNVPRIFYINSRVPDLLPQLRPVNYRLPRAFKRFFLYEFSQDEESFARSVNIEVFRCHPDIDTIYESQISLEMRAILSLGSVCRFSGSNRGRDATTVFNFDDLQVVPKAPIFYRLSDLFSVIFIFETGDDVHGLAVFGLVWNDECYVIAVDPSGNRAIPSIGEELRSAASIFFSLAHCNVQAMVFRSQAAATKSIQKILSDTKRSAPIGKSILVATCMQHESMFSVDFFAKDQAMPMIKLNLCNWERFPPLDWQRFCCKKFCEAFKEFDPTILRLEQLSNYGRVPFMNLCSRKDPTSFLIDVAFARALKDAGHILWWDDSTTSDLGRRECDWQIVHAADQNDDIYHCVSDVYRGITFELDISNSLLNTLLASSHINDLEGCKESETFDEEAHKVTAIANSTRNSTFSVSLSDNQFSKSALSLLKSVISTWYKEAVSTENSIAIHLLQAFDYWLCSRRSAMHDSLLTQRLRSLSKKMFMQLIAYLREHGASIVYCVGDRMLLSNLRKPDLESALEWLSFVCTKTQEHDLFMWLNVRTLHSYRWLLFRDYDNFFAVAAEDGSFASEFSLLGSLRQSEKTQDAYNAALNLLLEYSQLVFIDSMQSEDGKTFVEKSQHPSTEDCQEFLEGAEFSRKCFEIIRRLHRQFGTGFAIKFARFLFSILSVDSAAHLFHHKLRRNCLTLLGTSDFSAAASFSDDELHVIPLECVICSACARMSSVRVTSHDFSRCIHCNSSDGIHRVLEENLIYRAEQLITSYHVQDASCCKCRMQKVSTMDMRCRCSGTYKAAAISRDFLRIELCLLRNLSISHSFVYLKMFLESYL